MPSDFDTTIALGTNLPPGPYDVTIGAPRTGRSWATEGSVAEATLWLRAADVRGTLPVGRAALEGTWRERLGTVAEAYDDETDGEVSDEALLAYLAAQGDALGPDVEANAGLERRRFTLAPKGQSDVVLELEVLVPVAALFPSGDEGLDRGVARTLLGLGAVVVSGGEWTSAIVPWAKNSPPPRYRGELGALPRLQTARSLRGDSDPPVSDPLEFHFPGISKRWDDAYERFFRPLVGRAPTGHARRRAYRSVTARYIDPKRIHRAFRPFFSVDKADSIAAVRQMGFRPTVTERYPEDVQYDQWLVDRMLNGVHPCLFRRGTDDDQYVVDLSWNAYPFALVKDRNYLAADEQHKYGYEQPNVRATLRKYADELRLEEIAIQYRKQTWLPPATDDAHLEPWRTYAPGDGVRWRYAKHVFRCAWSFAGQTDFHLTRGHLVAEQYLAALKVEVERGETPKEGRYEALSSDNQHPLWRLLFPFLQEVDRINAFGDSLVIGTTGVLPVLSALSTDGVAARLGDQLAGVDWKGFSPRAPVVTGHRFARTANLYWKVLSQYVTAEVKREWAAYEAQWEVVERFSRALTERSLPHRAYGGVPADDQHWHDTGELSSRTEGEPAMSPLRPKNRDDLIALATHAIYHATFLHSWVNDRQWEDCADPEYCSFALMARREPGPSESYTHWAREAWPLVKHAAFQKALMTMLAHLDVGYIARPDSDPEYRGLAKRLRAVEEDFAQLSTEGPFAEQLHNSAAQKRHGSETAITQIRGRANT